MIDETEAEFNRRMNRPENRPDLFAAEEAAAVRLSERVDALRAELAAITMRYSDRAQFRQRLDAIRDTPEGRRELTRIALELSKRKEGT